MDTMLARLIKFNKANISKGLLYNYFESKEELLRNIMTNIMDRYMEKYPPIDFFKMIVILNILLTNLLKF